MPTKLFNKKIYLIGLIALLFQSCIFVKPVHITNIKSIEIEALSVKSAKMNLRLQIENPNRIKINVTDIDLTVIAENELIGTIKELDNIIIPAKSNQVVNVKLDVSFTNVLTKAFKIVKILSGSDARVKLQGTIKTKAFLFSKTFPVDEEDIVSLFKQ